MAIIDYARTEAPAATRHEAYGASPLGSRLTLGHISVGCGMLDLIQYTLRLRWGGLWLLTNKRYV